MSKFKLFMDPVYGEFVRLEKDSYLDRVVSHPYLQRLRYIRQLGPCYLVYPGAEHTRFQHSLGVMWLAEKAFSYLKLNGFNFDEEIELAVKLAALTHDLGHSPFSHALEGKILNRNHESLTVWALKALGEEVKLPKELMDGAVKVIQKRHEKPYAYQLVSSQLDCDRLDYLSRDSFFTGVAFGRVEVNRILISALLEGDELVWSFKGFNSLESYVMSRYQMYWAVYFHKGNISAQVLLQKIIKRVKELLKDGVNLELDRNLKEALKEESKKAFFNLTDGSVISSVYLLRDSKDKVLRDLAERFTKRALFKAVEASAGELLQLREKVEKLGFDPKYYFEVVEPSKVAYSYYSPDGKDVIKVKVGKRIEELSNVAPTDAVKALSRKVSKTYAVVPPEVLL
ncbi:HD domain-containing protein [Thermovibrio sp.]